MYILFNNHFEAGMELMFLYYTVMDSLILAFALTIILVKGAVSYYTHMLLRITNLKALGQRFQV